MDKSKLLIIDLEATCSDDNAISRSNMETIEIGGAIVALTDLALVDSFQLYIKPVVTPLLTTFCTELTGIEQATVNQTEPFGLAISHYQEWLEVHPDIVAWASWGNYDKGQFELDYARHGISDVHAGLPHLNLKNLFGEAVGERRMGLGRAIEFAGARFEGRHHSGKDDAINMARLLTLEPRFGHLIRTKLNQFRGEQI
ncbi:MAG: 3'-5' exonuclease [Pseudomonadota bacterium]